MILHTYTHPISPSNIMLLNYLIKELRDVTNTRGMKFFSAKIVPILTIMVPCVSANTAAPFFPFFSADVGGGGGMSSSALCALVRGGGDGEGDTRGGILVGVGLRVRTGDLDGVFTGDGDLST